MNGHKHNERVHHHSTYHYTPVETAKTNRTGNVEHRQRFGEVGRLRTAEEHVDLHSRLGKTFHSIYQR